MSAVTFDTLKFVETLENAGIERPHASAVAAAVRDSHVNADVATKGDIALLQKEIEAVHAKIEAQSNKIIVQVGGLFIAILGAIEIVNRVWPAQ